MRNDLLLYFTYFCTLFSLQVYCGADYYATLGILKKASKDEIRRAYKRLSVQYHPDKNQGDEEAQKRFVEVAHAYEVLYDEKKRSIYDKYGEEGLKQGAGGESDFHDPFDMFMQ
jgi:DnaJ-related protein SCJ1